MTNTNELLDKLDYDEAVRLRRGAKAAARVERVSKKALDAYFALLEVKAIMALQDGLPPPGFDCLDILLENAYQAMFAGFVTIPKLPKKEDRAMLARDNKTKIRLPRTPAELRKWWDMVRKNKAPARIQKHHDAIKKEYLKKTQELWTKVSTEFRQGGVWTQDDAKAALRPIFAVPQKRANIIVATETTRYFNQARKNYYDEQPTVTHYLYIAIRDKRTTDWCKDRQGLIYKKDSDVLQRETPPIHYQCRSEITPLSPYNPKHKKLIEDKSRWRENKKPKPKPLLEGWNE